MEQRTTRVNPSEETIKIGPLGIRFLLTGEDSNSNMNSTDPKLTPNPRPDPAESAGPTGWLNALNSFLERAFLKADVDTGC